jgi:hypothetical protein
MCEHAQDLGIAGVVRGIHRDALACPLLTPCGMREADHPRILELVLGRMLELVVYSVEGVRERWGRGKVAVH